MCVCVRERHSLYSLNAFFIFILFQLRLAGGTLPSLCFGVIGKRSAAQLLFYKFCVAHHSVAKSFFFFFFLFPRIFVWSGCVRLARFTKPALSCTSSRNECRHAFRPRGKKGHKADLFVLLILRTPTARQTHLQLSCRHSAHDSLMTCPERKKNGRL